MLISYIPTPKLKNIEKAKYLYIYIYINVFASSCCMSIIQLLRNLKELFLVFFQDLFTNTIYQWTMLFLPILNID